MIIMTHRGKRTEHPTIAAASADFSEKRDASGEGASTFPNAELYAADGTTYLGYVSYNRCVTRPALGWSDERRDQLQRPAALFSDRKDPLQDRVAQSAARGTSAGQGA